MKTPTLARNAALVVVVSLSMAACTKNSPPAAAATNAPVATVNGKPIGSELLESYATVVARRPASELTPDQRSQILDNLIGMQLAAELAEKSGEDKKPDIASQLALSRINVLMESTMKKYMTEHPVTDAELKAEYDTQVATIGRQYSGRHILVDSKAAANAIIDKLKGGADFAKLAEKESSDGTGKKGGDLGWFSLSNMPKPFADAIAALDKGKYTTEPVQTQFGWHVIKLEDFRSPEAPKFEDVKEQVQNIVQRKKLQAYMEELRKGAKIEKKELAAATPAKTETGPAAPTIPAAPAPEPKK